MKKNRKVEAMKYPYDKINEQWIAFCPFCETFNRVILEKHFTCKHFAGLTREVKK